MTTQTTASTVSFWINGRPTAARGSRHGLVTNAATGQVVRTVPFANDADVNFAVESARAAFPAWRATTPLRRARILMRFRDLLAQHTDEIAAAISEEHG